MLRLKFIALTIAFIVIGQTAHADDWREYKTKNLIVYSNIPDAVVKDLIRDTERMIPYLADVSGIGELSTPKPLTMYLFRTTSDVQNIIGEQQVLGVYRPLLRGGVAVTVGITPVDARKLGGRSVVLHEYVHHYLSQLSPLDYPTWYIEGFADVLSNINFTNSSVRVGDLLIPRIRMLNDRSSWAPLEDIMSASVPDVGKTQDWRGHDRFYSQAWLLAHMLTTVPALSQNSRHFLKELSSGVSPEDALRAAYGMTYDEFNNLYKSHWKMGLQIEYVDLNKRPFMEPTLSIRELSSDEARAVKWQAQVDFSEQPERLAEILSGINAELKSEESVRLRLLLTEVLLKFERPDLAMKQVEQMIKLEPDNLDVHFMKAKVKLDIAVRRYTGLGPEGVDPQIYKDAHHYLSGVIEKEPENTEALFHFGILHFLNDDADIGGDGIEALKRAQKLVPQNQEVTLLLAQMYSKLGDVGAACENANIVLKYSREEKLQQRALKVIVDQPTSCPA